MNTKTKYYMKKIREKMNKIKKNSFCEIEKCYAKK